MSVESTEGRKTRVAKQLRGAISNGWAYMYCSHDGNVYNLFEEAAMLLDRPTAPSTTDSAAPRG